ncbi:MAG: vitamin B12 dependent-methionine synthase activation domain-containing protein [Planctomycetota bacterium]
MPASTTSLYQPVEHRQDNSFLIVGERCNASGSRKFKKLLETEDWDGIISMARQQVREGSHVLDVNADYAGRDNASDMAQIVQRLVRQVDSPLMIDSTQIATMDAGLRHAPGKCIINSANFEDGEEKFDEICALAVRYNAALVIGTIDEDKEAAMARTADRKLSIAQRAIERARTVHGLAVEDIFIDPLVLPISTGMADDRRSALELIEGTRRIAEAYPEVQLVCGLSNVSFGLKPAARVVLNSVFLHELTEAGMTGAIVHAGKILPLMKIDEEQKAAALDLIYDRRAPSNGGTSLPEPRGELTFAEDFDPLQHFIDLFKDVDSIAGAKKEKKNLTLEEKLRAHIIDGEKEGVQQALDTAMEKYTPLQIINEHLLDGMKTVGELFGSGQMQLPFVLQSAEVMKMAVAHLEPHMEKVEGEEKGSIVLATVKGDVHDIGKNLVDIILTNNGYTVHNIGIKQPLSSILDAWRETNAGAIGLSGLLVKSVNVMEENLKELNDLGIDVPVILGGAALTRHYAEGYLRSVYKGPLLYGKDAFEGLRTMDLLAEGQLAQLHEEIEERQSKRASAQEAIAKASAKPEPASDGGTAVATRVRSEVATDVAVPEAPFWGDRLIESISLDDIYPFINPTALFKGQWQFKKGKRSTAEYDAQMQEEILPLFESLKARCRDEQILQPQVVYGYWPCQSDGDDLIVYDAADHDREIERFSFPRQSGRKRLCISDFFRSVDSGEKDVIAMHCVTMGSRASDEARKLFESDRYSEYLYLHGLGVETAEALAELWHKRIRAELGFGGEDSPRIKELFTQKYRGSRYSFGYPACPDMSDQDKLFRLLKPQRIGCELTDNWQIDPEQSTSAIVVHHPEAKYFNV